MRVATDILSGHMLQSKTFSVYISKYCQLTQRRIIGPGYKRIIIQYSYYPLALETAYVVLVNLLKFINGDIKFSCEYLHNNVFAHSTVTN